MSEAVTALTFFDYFFVSRQKSNWGLRGLSKKLKTPKGCHVKRRRNVCISNEKILNYVQNDKRLKIHEFLDSLSGFSIRDVIGYSSIIKTTM
ncbi:hypothetical protein DDZ16_12395 [Marinilabilia rubra]|uniref:Uncharacterized protein n=1 Tax=Marinilabilia rubra TaxID=2162893 RepID=A0A2U2B7L9_9BACT|nr:hypothetical protein DDZ16_12395 [Marinilabilia rubra]